MKKPIGLMALGLSMILLSGCGSDDNDDNPPLPQTIQGTVVGSHYEGAWVCVDANSNDRCDGEETKTVSDANGNWTLDNPHNNALSVVAEIYVDNIKHSDYPAPPTATLVEKPMIFIAPLQGMVDDQLIVSPISTMVYRSMQTNGTTFEVAKESVANELGVSSDTLLTNYNVENPSADHVTLQQHSATETEKLGLSMIYHDNHVEFIGNIDYFDDIHYEVRDFYIPSAQDPDHYIEIGSLLVGHYISDSKYYLNFHLGRKGSTNVANWWNRRVKSNQSNYDYEPDNLNFAMKGNLTVYSRGDTYVFSDFYIAQEHAGLNNVWLIGGPKCKYSHSSVTCTSDNSGDLTFFNCDSVSEFEIDYPL